MSKKGKGAPLTSKFPLVTYLQICTKVEEKPRKNAYKSNHPQIIWPYSDLSCKTNSKVQDLLFTPLRAYLNRRQYGDFK